MMDDANGKAAGRDRLRGSFARAKTEARGHLIVYLTAGDPDLDATAELVPALAEAGVDAVELGIPFSDPLADGPIIQAAAQRALERGCTVRRVLECVRRIRDRTELPLAFMTSYNPILRMGPEEFVARSAEAGVDGVLVTDLPPSEAGRWVGLLKRQALRSIFLVAPSSTPERVGLATRLSTGFVYCVSRPGVTGVRDELPEDLTGLVARIRQATAQPIAVGFGVSTAEHVRAICAIADSAIVGSAMVKTIAEARDRDAAKTRAVAFARQLAEGTRR
jgi:tryptophan synthase alpha chain